MCSRLSALLCLSCLTFSGCTVKEDRGSCPCSLRLAFEGSCLTGPVALAWRICNMDIGFISGYDEQPGELMLNTPRCVADMYVCVSEISAMNESGGLDIGFGDDCPPVFCCRADVECRGDYAESVVGLHKNYAELSCILEHSDALGHELEYSVIGNVCGYDGEGTPVHGPFRYMLGCRKNSSGTMLADVRLPRQTDNSLKLDVCSPDGDLLREFSLGEYISASGYDWSAEDLENIVIQINIASTKLSVNVLTEGREAHLSYSL